MGKITLHDKTFKPFISYSEIEKAIGQVADKLNKDFENSDDIPILLCTLNGAIMFTSELMKRLNFISELVTIKLSSYSGTESTGQVSQVIGLTTDVKDRRVIVVEDIVDTGTTIVALKQFLQAQGAREIRICTLLLKPDSYHGNVKLDYVAMEIPNDFIVGFGLDYDNLGRSFKDIYVLDSDSIQKKHMKYFILFGPPGAGKGTQASAMVENFHLCHLSTGDLLRKEMAAGSELGLKAKALINAGELVPDEIVEGMIENQFNTVTGVDGFLLDGFPRTIAQAEALNGILAKKGEEVTSVVSLMIPDEMIKERISHRAAIEGRADDANEEVIANRIRTYHDKTEPLIAFYKGAGKYNEIDGTGTIEEVRGRIADLMSKH